MKIKEVIQYLENAYPKDIAMDFDQNKIGFTIGDEEEEVSNILCTLDLTSDVVDEAIEKNVNLIVGHHPFIFDPLYKIIKDDVKGKIIYQMIEHHISYFSMHTNLDAGYHGVNDVLGHLLEIDSKDYGIATKNKLLRSGKIKPCTLKELAKNVQEKFKLSGVRIAGDPEKIIHHVGIVGGSGGQAEAIDEAIKEGCECYITGEIKLQNAIYALERHLTLIEVNHGVEKLVFTSIKDQLINNFHFPNQVYISRVSTDPFKTYVF